uniref:T-box domain-containing protein n=1 Tax=Caenorhabditis japonica TaxID=281687 RepID=A0A8R1HXH2_CAEJA
MSSAIQLALHEPKTWQEFHPNTEMIVTRKRGRVIFPHLDYLISGLEPTSLYSVFVHLERVDNVKYKFDQGEWQYATKGDPIREVQYYEHPHGARSGEHWMSDPVSFASLKITNDPMCENPKLIIVQSMHKYQPVVTIKKIGNFRGEEFRLKVTEFMVVTAYQSNHVNDLKKKHNKFASGFRAERGEAKRTPSTEFCSESSSSTSSYSPGIENFPAQNFPMQTNMNPFYPAAPINQFFDFNSYWNPAYNYSNPWNGYQNVGQIPMQNGFFPTWQHPQNPILEEPNQFQPILQTEDQNGTTLGNL